MTLPDERYRAIVRAQHFLDRLASGDYKRVPKAVRAEATSILRHYPSQYHVDRLTEKSPDIIIKELEPLTRMIMAYPTHHDTEN